MELIERDGFRPNSKIYCYGDWIYHKCQGTSNRYYCAQRSTKFACPVVLYKYDTGKIEVDESEHNHIQPNRNTKLEIIKKLKKEALNNLPVQEIVDKVLKTYKNPTINVAAARQIVARTIAEHQKDSPSNMFELSEYLQSNELYSKFFVGEAVTKNRKEIAIFLGSTMLINKLKVAAEVTVDGSFRCLSANLEADQLLTFHLHEGTNGITALYILCSARSYELYGCIFRKLKEMKILNLKKAMCPYDHIIVESLKEVLPEVIIRGSLFSFVKLMSRKWSSLDLPKDYNHTVFKTSMILKLLPSEKVEEGIKVVKHQAELESDSFEDLLAFAKFVEKCLPLIEKSTFTGDNINEAIDYAESHNLHMVKQLGKHEALHSFLKLLKINIKKNEDLSKSRGSHNEMKVNVRVTKSIVKEQEKFKNKNQTVEKLLNFIMQTNMEKFLMLQLSWPQYRDDAGKLLRLPNFHCYHIESKPSEDCVYCMTEKASVQINLCKHVIACMTCWIFDYYSMKRRRCPLCRTVYDKVTFH